MLGVKELDVTAGTVVSAVSSDSLFAPNFVEIENITDDILYGRISATSAIQNANPPNNATFVVQPYDSRKIDADQARAPFGYAAANISLYPVAAGRVVVRFR